MANKIDEVAVQVETSDFEQNLQEKVFVDVQGEVVNPGVFEVDHDVRIGYLIELAGGLTIHANTRGLNRAGRIYDEMVIFVPHIDEIIEINAVESEGETPSGQIVDDSGLISINEATALELESLPGIGPALSANIIEYREKNGSFSAIDELNNVAGIGAIILENIRDFIRL